MRHYWAEFGRGGIGRTRPRIRHPARARRSLAPPELDERIRSRAEHWRIERMAVVDRNVLGSPSTNSRTSPRRHTSPSRGAGDRRRFSTYEATQFINGILDAIKRDLDQENRKVRSSTRRRRRRRRRDRQQTDAPDEDDDNDEEHSASSASNPRETNALSSGVGSLIRSGITFLCPPVTYHCSHASSQVSTKRTARTQHRRIS